MTAAKHADAILRAAGLPSLDRMQWDDHHTAILAAVQAAMDDAVRMERERVRNAPRFPPGECQQFGGKARCFDCMTRLKEFCPPKEQTHD